MKKVLFIWMFVFVLSLVSVSAVTCEFDLEPFHNQKFLLEDRFFWYCSFNDTVSNYSCFTEIEQNGDIIQLNPRYDLEKDLGLIDNDFKSVDGKISVYFTDRNIYENVLYNATIHCSKDGVPETFTTEIRPRARDLHDLNYRILWLGSNARPITLIGLILAFIFVIFGFIVPDKIKSLMWTVAVLIILYLVADSLKLI